MPEPLEQRVAGLYEEVIFAGIAEELRKTQVTITNLRVREQRMRQERDEIVRIKEAEIEHLKTDLQGLADYGSGIATRPAKRYLRFRNCSSL